MEIKSDISDFRKILRKMTILKNLKHDNLVELKSSLVLNSHVFLEFDFIEYNLKQVLKEKNRGLTDDHVKYIFYQTVLSVAYLHSQGVEHLNLRPEAVLLTNECDVKLSKMSEANPSFLPKPAELKSIYQDYYVAPEMILNNGNNTHCSFKADIWALGCIFFELLERKNVLNYKRQYLDQLKWMFRLLGSPERKDLKWVRNLEAKKWVSSLGSYSKREPSSYVGENNASSVARDLLDKMLKINPLERLDVEQILKHEYFQELFHERDILFGAPRVKIVDFMPCHPSNKNLRAMKHAAINLGLE
jgi:serine/threonine protein kinase